MTIMRDEQHAAAKTDREYGELYYRADTVSAILRTMAQLLESDQRSTMLHLSSNIPSTMRWDDHSPDGEQTTGQSDLYRSIQLRLQYNALFGSGSLRLDALLRRGPSPVRPIDGEHLTGLADQQSDVAP